jgi:hypothetical protein
LVPIVSTANIFSQPETPVLSDDENEVLMLVNGSRAYAYDISLENIAYDHYAFRSAGSAGATEAANWIKTQFEGFGLETQLEPFQLTTWDLSDQPSLVIDDDGNETTTFDQTVIASFQCEHFSWPTPTNGTFSDLVILPLPAAADYSQIGVNPIDMNAWNAINTTAKIVLIGKEVRWSSSWHLAFRNKLTSQPPSAVIYTWWYDWMSFTPPMFGSTGGRPLGGNPYFWNLHIPTSDTDYNDGVWIRNRENSIDVSARVSIPSTISTGAHYNVVGKIDGYVDPEKRVIVCGHYDTIMGSGFCDNGAGTAGVLEVAKTLTDAVKQGIYRPTYTLLFIALAAEEIGLAGSINYIAQHKTEMTKVRAVINLDCIGSDNFTASQTDPMNGLDLDQVVLQAAADLGVDAQTEPSQGDSDHAPFLDPAWANSIYSAYWGIDANITDAQPIQASVGMFSLPLIYSSQWIDGEPGWIHTAWDNSTSTANLNWVEIIDLLNHIKIVALTTMRVSPNAPELPRNIAVTVIMPYKNIIPQNYTARINVTVQNQGGYAEYVNITVYANSTTIATQNDAYIPGSTSANFTLLWNATSFVPGFYDIQVEASPLTEETNMTDNTLDASGTQVVIAGDVTSAAGPPDGKVDMRDIALVCAHFMRTPSHPAWDANMDINDDFVVNMRDISIACANFGRHYP